MGKKAKWQMAAADWRFGSYIRVMTDDRLPYPTRYGLQRRIIVPLKEGRKETGGGGLKRGCQIEMVPAVSELVISYGRTATTGWKGLRPRLELYLDVTYGCCTVVEW